jgi:WD40-like Beta Propeller Repeat
VNNIRTDFAPFIAGHGETLYFSSNRDGGFGNTDLYMTTRSKSHGHDESH